MATQCEDCKFANWDATLFRDREEGHFEGMHYIPPYSEQFDFYCSQHKQFYLEQETPLDCEEGVTGENNFYDVCKKHWKERNEFLEELRKKKEQEEKEMED